MRVDTMNDFIIKIINKKSGVNIVILTIITYHNKLEKCTGFNNRFRRVKVIDFRTSSQLQGIERIAYEICCIATNEMWIL